MGERLNKQAQMRNSHVERTLHDRHKNGHDSDDATQNDGDTWVCRTQVWRPLAHAGRAHSGTRFVHGARRTHSSGHEMGSPSAVPLR